MSTQAADFWALYLSLESADGKRASPQAVRFSLETLDRVDERAVAVAMRWLTWSHSADEIDLPLPGKWTFVGREQVGCPLPHTTSFTSFGPFPH